MRSHLTTFRIAWLSFAALSVAAPPVSAPVFSNEQLHYNINWPSGLSLGEAALGASSAKAASGEVPGINLQFNVDAGIPGFSVTDHYHSVVTPDFCSSEFQRNATHGQKKIDEKMTFDPHGGSGTRETAGGGKTDFQTSGCGKDALAFLYYLRRELAQGRIPPPQTVYLGPAYDVRLEFMGTQNIRVADKPVEADRVTASIRGPASEISVEIFFLKDSARTPVLARVPLALGTFSMELVR